MLRKFSTGWKVVRQLGLEQTSLNLLYKIGLKGGLWKRLTPPRQTQDENLPDSIPALFPADFAARYREFMRDYPQAVEEITEEASEILAGQVRLFGGPLVPLDLTPHGPLIHWSEYETGKVKPEGDPDLKMIWEPARFGWSFTLARAYLLSEDDRYASCFWENTGEFLAANPTNLGPNWMSAQEVALRLMALLGALEIFSSSPVTTPERRSRLLTAIVDHARRIPPTLLYARSQFNNHLLTEAAGLYTAGVLLHSHPEASRWRLIGWKWANYALQTQIAPDGTYAQHSANYLRLMLQSALWIVKIARIAGDELPVQTSQHLSAATEWLHARLDPVSGKVANLGSNDGAYILPLASGGIQDFRPVVQSAALAFERTFVLPHGPWEEMALWLCEESPEVNQENCQFPSTSGTLRPDSSSFASLRAVRFTSRPSQADQLHVDLWWHGLNIARDAGTYRYTAAPPWDNSLSTAMVHNTITIDGHEPMLRAGKFLYLDWDQARWLKQSENACEAEHNGYLQLGVTHRRRLEWLGNEQWQVVDTLLAAKSPAGEHKIVLHWLLPDWPWALDDSGLILQASAGSVRISVKTSIPDLPVITQLVRAGELIQGSGPVLPVFGWYSPTYNVKEPALSFRVLTTSRLPLTLISMFSMRESGKI